MSGRPQKEFSSAEHRYLGDIKLRGLPSEFQKFKFPTGAEVSFGEIIALAGDYFGLYLAPIALGPSEKVRQDRFMQAYQELETCPPEKIYAITRNISNEDRDNKILITDVNEHVLMLAMHNIDHFNDYAVSAFSAGYELAMRAAVRAADESDEKTQQEQLAYAYTLLAYACHFITDRFAAGHIRTPRMELDQMFAPEIGSIMAFFQHNEDGDLGLELQSASVDDPTLTSFMAYGDGHLFEVRDSECRQRVMRAVQVAADEVYQAFVSKKAIAFEDSVLNRLIPTVTNNNHSPLFKMNDDGELMYRFYVTDPYSDCYVQLNRVRAIGIIMEKGRQFVGTAIGDKIEMALQWLKGEAQVDQGTLVDQSIFKPQTDPDNKDVMVIKIRSNLVKP